MLVLSRKKGESIIIGDDIVITLNEIRGNQKARVAVKAPGSVPVHRKEVYDRIVATEQQREQEEDDIPGNLVLTREKNEVIMIGDRIAITIVEIRHDKVRFGIQAPVEVSVHRMEVYEAIQSQRRTPPTSSAT